jgi:acetyl esterase
MDAITRAIGRPLLRAPSPVRTLWTARRPIEIDERRLDPHLQHVLFVMRRGSRPIETLPLHHARRVYDGLPKLFEDGVPPGVTSSPLVLAGPTGGLAARVYRPVGVSCPPVLVYLHGGGGVLGSIRSHDGVCRRIATRARCLVVSVEYRLAPEAPFPAAVHDATAAFAQVAARAAQLGGDPTRVGVGGDSMGGNLSAVVAQQCRDQRVRAPIIQLLIYPATDGRAGTASLERLSRGFGLDAGLMRWFRATYLAGADPLHPLASPAMASDLGGLCPAIVATAGYDPLRDEGDAYAASLDGAGVPTRHLHFPGLAHTFVQMTGIVPAAALALDQIADELHAAFERARVHAQE